MEPNTIGENWIQLARMCGPLGIPIWPLSEHVVRIPLINPEEGGPRNSDLRVSDAVAEVARAGAVRLRASLTNLEEAKANTESLAIFAPYLEAE